MSAIFLAFANDPNNRLPTLSQEDDQVYATLSRRAAQQHFTLHRDSFATTSKVSEFLVLYRDSISVFLYSGHAERDALLLEDEAANAQGIAYLLGQCPNLKLVILNGCSTGGQVERLLQLSNNPIVIATSAPVNDFAATQFSIRFFQALSEQFDTIENAFQAGLGAAQLVSQAATRAGRQQLPENTSKEPVWGIFYNPAAAVNLTWTLPTDVSMVTVGYEPNTYLIRNLIDVFAPYNMFALQIQQDEKKGKKRNVLDKRETILQCLPHPVSEQLRRLLVPGQTGSDAKFYDKFGVDRLGQLVITYSTLIELTSFVMLSQLWNALSINDKLLITNSQRDLLSRFFQLKYQERTTYDFFPFIKTIRDIFDQNDIGYFVEELENLTQVFNEQSDFYNACVFLETLKRRFANRAQFEKAEADSLCIIAEEKLTAVFTQLGFLARYRMASIKDIDVLKYRHLLAPRFRHKVVELVQRLGGLAEEMQDLENYMENSSVLLQKEGEEKQFLNLSPFIIDENAFEEKATDAKLYYFDRYEKAADIFIFKHIYKPDDPPLMIGRQENYLMLKEQFNAFAQLLFQKPLNAL